MLQRLLTISVASVILCGAFGSGCADVKPRPKQEFVMRVSDLSGELVAGADVISNDVVVGTTKTSGIASFALTGSEGELVSFQVRCPAGYTSPKDPVVARWLAVEAGAASLRARCRKVQHRLVVAVRADGGPNLPILRLGNVVGTTDAGGAANLMFDVNVDERLELSLATASLAKEKVTPVNPAATFDLGDADDVKVFDVKFVRPKPAPKRAAPRPKGPVPIS